MSHGGEDNLIAKFKEIESYVDNENTRDDHLEAIAKEVMTSKFLNSENIRQLGTDIIKMFLGNQVFTLNFFQMFFLSIVTQSVDESNDSSLREEWKSMTNHIFKLDLKNKQNQNFPQMRQATKPQPQKNMQNIKSLGQILLSEIFDLLHEKVPSEEKINDITLYIKWGIITQDDIKKFLNSCSELVKEDKEYYLSEEQKNFLTTTLNPIFIQDLLKGEVNTKDQLPEQQKEFENANQNATLRENDLREKITSTLNSLTLPEELNNNFKEGIEKLRNNISNSSNKIWLDQVLMIHTVLKVVMSDSIENLESILFTENFLEVLMRRFTELSKPLESWQDLPEQTLEIEYKIQHIINFYDKFVTKIPFSALPDNIDQAKTKLKVKIEDMDEKYDLLTPLEILILQNENISDENALVFKFCDKYVKHVRKCLMSKTPKIKILQYLNITLKTI